MTEKAFDMMGRKLRDGEQVLLYGAGNDILSILARLDARYHVRPAAIGDGDKNKWGKRILGIPVLGPRQLTERFSDSFIYIDSCMYKAQIIAELTETYGISPEKILNWEPVHRIRSCPYLEYYLTCETDCIDFCCPDYVNHASPRVQFAESPEQIIDRFIGLRDKQAELLNLGLPASCDGCSYIKEDWYTAERKIAILNYSEGGACNFDCCYCRSAARNSMKFSQASPGFPALLAEVSRRKLLAEDAHICLSAGEITVDPRRHEIYKAVRDVHFVQVFTNASIYDRELAELVHSGNTTLFVSVDAGTKETYAKIKGRDVYDRVCENLDAYSNQWPNAVYLKYIFPPEINDNERDVDGFLKLCARLQPAVATVSYDMFAPQTLNGNTYRMVRRMIEGLDAASVVWKTLSSAIDRALQEN